MASTVITPENFGVWLIKCRLSDYDLRRFVEDGGRVIDGWSLQRGSRSRMMQPGDRVIFWVSGSDKRFPRGIWGVGHLTSRATDRYHDPDASGGYWLNETKRLAVDHGVDTDLPLLLDAPLLDSVLKANGITDPPVQRQANDSNPSWVSKVQLAKIDSLLGPDVLPPRPGGEVITVTPTGAGFGDPARNARVEVEAMRVVTERYEAEGFQVDDVSRQKVGWDLTCARPDSVRYLIEVKGVSGGRPSVLLIANEVRAASAEPDWWLAVVVYALSGAPKMIEYHRDDVVEAATPYVLRADLAAMDAY